MFDVSLIGFMAPGMKKIPNLMPDVYLLGHTHIDIVPEDMSIHVGYVGFVDT